MNANSNNKSQPSVVLVHGAFADASSWTGVIERLQAHGVQVIAAANPLRGIKIDSDYIASLLNQIPGPVVAVGHSYGGALITNAAAQATNVVGLVYVAAYAPDEREVLEQVSASSKDSALGTALRPIHYPLGHDDLTAVEFLIQPARFHEVFAADLTDAQTAVLIATQRPISQLAFTEPTTAAAWKTLPSWAVVATDDKAAGADIVRAMAQRAKATITEVAGSHVIMISQPKVVADVILTAVAAVAAVVEAG